MPLWPGWTWRDALRVCKRRLLSWKRSMKRLVDLTLDFACLVVCLAVLDTVIWDLRVCRHTVTLMFKYINWYSSYYSTFKYISSLFSSFLYKNYNCTFSSSAEQKQCAQSLADMLHWTRTYLTTHTWGPFSVMLSSLPQLWPLKNAELLIGWGEHVSCCVCAFKQMHSYLYLLVKPEDSWIGPRLASLKLVVIKCYISPSLFWISNIS